MPDRDPQPPQPSYELRDSKPAVEIKGSVFTLTVLRLQSDRVADIERDLAAKIAQGPRFFEYAPVVLDLAGLDDGRGLDFDALVGALKTLKLIPVGVRHATPKQREPALAAGLAIVKGGERVPRVREKPTERPAPTTETPAVPPAANPPTVRPARTINRPIRSGQQVYARGGDLIVLGAVNAGAEIVADGNVHVYGPLRGRALAGVGGDKGARIFCQSMEAQLVSVAGHYEVFDDAMPSGVHRRAVQVYLQGDQLRIEPLSSS